MSMKNSKETIGNRTRNLPARSALPQPTAPLRAPILSDALILNNLNYLLHQLYLKE
jgi:hypothetical protein